MKINYSTIGAILLLFSNLALLLILLFWEWSTTDFSRFAKTAKMRAAKEDTNLYCLNERSTYSEKVPAQLLLYNTFGTTLLTWQSIQKRFKQHVFLKDAYLPLICQPSIHDSSINYSPPSRMFFNEQFFLLSQDDRSTFKIDNEQGSIALSLSNLYDLAIPSQSLTFLLRNRNIIPHALKSKLRYPLQTEWKGQKRTQAYRDKPYCYRDGEQPFCLWGNRYSLDKSSVIQSIDNNTIHIFLDHQYMVKAIANRGKIYIDYKNNIFVFADYAHFSPHTAFNNIQKWLSDRLDSEVQELLGELPLLSILTSGGVSKDSARLNAMVNFFDSGKLSKTADLALTDEDKEYVSQVMGKNYDLVETERAHANLSNLFEQCGLQVYPIDFDTQIVHVSRWRDHLSWQTPSSTIDSTIESASPLVEVKIDAAGSPIILILDVNYPVHWLLMANDDRNKPEIASVILTGGGPQGFSSKLPIVGNVVALYKHPTCGHLTINEKQDPLRDSLHRWLQSYGAKDVWY